MSAIARWVPAGESATVKGCVIGAGMVYVGTDFRSPDASLIDPSLSVQFDRSQDRTVRQLGYWPRYREASPSARGAYLGWLADGKRDPEADIGFVFLYFYGLERRILVDGETDPRARDEFPLIEAEIVRLRGIYQDNPSFQGYSGSLLDFIRAHLGAAESPSAEPPTWTPAWDIPFAIRVGLAQFIAKGQPIPGEWAYAWWRAHPTTRPRTAAERCPEEFKRLFVEYYRQEHQPGLTIRPNKTRLTVVHRVASPSLPKRQYEHSFDLPDITVLSAPLKKLQATAECCHQALDRYSRHLGRKPENIGKIDALLELPTLLWPESMRTPLLKIHGMVSASGLSLAVRFDKLLSLLPPWETINKASYASFTRSLSQIGLGIEPDPRYGGELPDRAQSVVLFVDSPQALMAEPTGRYKTAALSLHLAVSVSQADGEVGGHERDLLMRQLEDWLHLDAGERLRLQAHLRRLIAEPPGLGGVKKRIAELAPPARESLADFLVRVAQADGQVSPGEVKLLERLFKLLELDGAGLYGKLHAPSVEPVTVRPAAQSPGGFAIPAPPPPAQPDGLNLDLSKVASLQADSHRITEILHAIFDDTPPPDSGTAPAQGMKPPEAEAETLWDLDAAHSELVRVLISRPHWTRAEWEELTADRGLLPDGALEHINEAAFDRFDQPLTEGDDPIEINPELIHEVTA